MPGVRAQNGRAAHPFIPQRTGDGAEFQKPKTKRKATQEFGIECATRLFDIAVERKTSKEYSSVCEVAFVEDLR